MDKEAKVQAYANNGGSKPSIGSLHAACMMLKRNADAIMTCDPRHFEALKIRVDAVNVLIKRRQKQFDAEMRQTILKHQAGLVQFNENTD